MISHSQPVGAPERVKMSWLEMYLMATRIMHGLEENLVVNNEFETVMGMLDFLGSNLTEEDRKYLKDNLRCKDEFESIDNNVMPTHVKMKWSPLRVHPMPQGIADAINASRNPHWGSGGLTFVYASDAITLADALESATLRLALMESQLPRVWTAQEFKGAPDGEYRWRNGLPEWYRTTSKSSLMTAIDKLDETFEAFGPIPQPPIEGQVR